MRSRGRFLVGLILFMILSVIILAGVLLGVLKYLGLDLLVQYIFFQALKLHKKSVFQLINRKVNPLRLIHAKRRFFHLWKEYKFLAKQHCFECFSAVHSFELPSFTNKSCDQSRNLLKRKSRFRKSWSYSSTLDNFLPLFLSIKRQLSEKPLNRLLLFCELFCFCHLIVHKLRELNLLLINKINSRHHRQLG